MMPHSEGRHARTMDAASFQFCNSLSHLQCLPRIELCLPKPETQSRAPLKQVRVDESKGWRTRLNISALRTKRKKVLSHARTKLGDVTTAVKTSVVKLSRSARNDSQSTVR